MTICLYDVVAATVIPAAAAVATHARGTASDMFHHCHFHLLFVPWHSGGGHYMAYVRRRAPNPSAAMRGESIPSGQLTDEWLWFSDQHCGAVPVEEVMAAEAYILFYERF